MSQKSKPSSLNLESLARGVAALSAIDPDLERIYLEYGNPPMWERVPGFPTLIYIILEQQVSLASARAAFTRLQEAIQPIEPERFLLLSDAELKAIGFSRQKTTYGRGLALSILNGKIDLDQLAFLGDEDVRSKLIKLKGIGPWTADIYLLMCLLRPDIWPTGDLALATAVQHLKGLENRPTSADLEAIAQPWRPWRAVAARLLWNYYLNKPRSAHQTGGEVKLGD